jgi:hypothetical protein
MLVVGVELSSAEAASWPHRHPVISGTCRRTENVLLVIDELFFTRLHHFALV